MDDNVSGQWIDWGSDNVHCCDSHTVSAAGGGCGDCCRLTHSGHDAHSCMVSVGTKQSRWNKAGCRCSPDVGIVWWSSGCKPVLTSWNSIRPQASNDAENAAGKLSFKKSAAAA